MADAPASRQQGAVLVTALVHRIVECGAPRSCASSVLGSVYEVQLDGAVVTHCVLGVSASATDYRCQMDNGEREGALSIELVGRVGCATRHARDDPGRAGACCFRRAVYGEAPGASHG